MTAIVRSYVGMGAVMDIAAVNRLMGGGLDHGRQRQAGPRGAAGLYAAVKAMPAVSSVALQSVSLQTLRATMAENILITTGVVFTALALTIAVGVAYNSARIQLSERARELVSLRVLGFPGRRSRGSCWPSLAC